MCVRYQYVYVRSYTYLLTTKPPAQTFGAPLGALKLHALPTGAAVVVAAEEVVVVVAEVTAPVVVGTLQSQGCREGSE